MEDTNERTIFCGNLSDEITEELLYELFLQAGPIEKVTIPKQKNFAFITFKHAISVPYTIDMFSGVILHRRTLRIQSRSRQNGNGQNNNQNSHHHHRSYSCPGDVQANQGQQNYGIQQRDRNRNENFLGQKRNHMELDNGPEPNERKYMRQGSYHGSPTLRNDANMNSFIPSLQRSFHDGNRRDQQDTSGWNRSRPRTGRY